MKKITAFLLPVMLVMSAAYTAYGMEYTDVKSGNWANEAISIMSDKAIIKGYPDGTFKPQNTIACGEFIKMALIAATGEDAGNAESGHWALNYYNSA
ncbi:MAG: S-layer homology domain-containing protein, partial [Eubacteriales bacterium]|nr:S-layer homology domain-containing protein [Eubacteriales bacterium]